MIDQSFCTKCGGAIDSGDAFCGSCGAALKGPSLSGSASPTGAGSSGSEPRPPQTPAAGISTARTAHPGGPSSLRIVLVAAILVFVVTVLAALFVWMRMDGTPTPSASGPSVEAPREGAVQVQYVVTAWGGREKYPDVSTGAEVKVTDGSGRLLGYGRLTQDEIGSYEFSADFDIKESTDGFYIVVLGNRGELSFSQSDVVNGVLQVTSQLN